MDHMGQPATHVRCVDQVGEDGMSGETVPMEETEAMDLSEADANIEVEESVMIVDGIGSFNAIYFLALTVKDILMTEFINL
ncbi:hypothetical protein AHAS_Ahas16G0128100 [Arachis hypogaea]